MHIIDQGSDAPTRDLLRAWVPAQKRVTAELLPENIGYGAGHNRSYARGKTIFPNGFDYFITINSDVLFGQPEWADVLVDAMEATPHAALGGPFAYTETPLGGGRRLLMPATVDQGKRGEFAFITGAVAIIRATAVTELGLFDEIYTPAYFEDQDMVQRYTHFGWGQVYIDLPVLHGYLGDAERVNQTKNNELQKRYGDFKDKNMKTYVSRWQYEKNKNSLAKENLKSRFNLLYFPSVG
nr:hypothetical protein [Pararhodospirillum oryzae]